MMSPELAAALRTIHDLAIGNQAQFIGLQNTVNAQAQAITELQQRILNSETAHAQTIMDLQQRLINSDQMWHASRSEVHGRIRQIEAAGSQSPTGRLHMLIDAKTLVPEVEPEGRSSLGWSWFHVSAAIIEGDEAVRFRSTRVVFHWSSCLFGIGFGDIWSPKAITPNGYGAVGPVRFGKCIQGGPCGHQIGAKLCAIILDEHGIDFTGSYHRGSELHSESVHVYSRETTGDRYTHRASWMYGEPRTMNSVRASLVGQIVRPDNSALGQTGASTPKV